MTQDEGIDLIKQDLETSETKYIPPNIDEARWIFNYTNIYWEIKARLMGGWITQDKQGNYLVVKPKGTRPMMSSTGIEETMATINAFVTVIQGLTWLDEDRILKLCLDLSVKLDIFYYINMEKFDLEPERASIVKRIVMNMVETNMRKSIAGNSMKLIGQTEKIVETRVEEGKKHKFLPW
jgi:hypothetical protein